MKKVMIGFALVCFVAFGTLSVQTTVASTDNTEMIQFNMDGDQDSNADATPDGKDKKKKKSTKECKESSKCGDKKSCCPSSEKKSEEKKEGEGVDIK
jgi:hypothetical protein